MKEGVNDALKHGSSTIHHGKTSMMEESRDCKMGKPIYG
jgi:hypothetical protein